MIFEISLGVIANFWLIFPIKGDGVIFPLIFLSGLSMNFRVNESFEFFLKSLELFIGLVKLYENGSLDGWDASFEAFIISLFFILIKISFF